jgi:hypothetical protein
LNLIRAICEGRPSLPSRERLGNSTAGQFNGWAIQRLGNSTAGQFNGWAIGWAIRDLKTKAG